MRGLPDKVIKLLAWRSRQPAIFRWMLAAILFGFALAGRAAMGRLHGANPALAFYPVIIIVAAFLGWQEAAALLAVSVGVGFYLFLPPEMYLQPVAWIVVGGLNILIIAILKNAAEQLVAANDQQRMLFQELQHRVANTLQAASGTIELAKRQIAVSPPEAAMVLDEAYRKMSAAADVHRRLNDPALVQTEFDTILRDAVTSVVDGQQVRIILDIGPRDLTLDQMSTIMMIVIECAHNAQKHVFRWALGSTFAVALMPIDGRRARLTIRDDGPGWGNEEHPMGRDEGLGQKLIQRLVNHLRGRMTLAPGPGTEISVDFPLDDDRGFLGWSIDKRNG